MPREPGCLSVPAVGCPAGASLPAWPVWPSRPPRAESVLGEASGGFALRSLWHVWNVSAEGTRVGAPALPACPWEQGRHVLRLCPWCPPHGRAPEGPRASLHAGASCFCSGHVRTSCSPPAVSSSRSASGPVRLTGRRPPRLSVKRCLCELGGRCQRSAPSGPLALQHSRSQQGWAELITFDIGC